MSNNQVSDSPVATQAETCAMNPSMLTASREKYWEEKSLEQKVDALRDMLMRLNADNKEFAESISGLLNHSHGASGEALVPLTQNIGVNRAISSGAYDRSHSIMTERERNRSPHGY